jgi:hypothetical protein
MKILKNLTNGRKGNGKPAPAPQNIDGACCDPQPKQPEYTLAGCFDNQGLPVMIENGKLVNDGSIEQAKTRVPSAQRFQDVSDRLCPALGSIDDAELVLHSGASAAYDLTASGNPGLYRITFTSPNRDATMAFRTSMELRFRQYTALGDGTSATGGSGRSGTMSFEIQTSADDAIIDVWVLPAVDLGDSKGLSVEPALLGGIVVGGEYINIAANTHFIGSDTASSAVTGTGPWVFGSSSPVLAGYTMTIRAYGSVSSTYQKVASRLLDNAR